MSAPDPVVVLTPRAGELARRGRLWFFADDLARVEAPAQALVRVTDGAGRGYGVGLYSAASNMRLRLAGPGDDALGPAAHFGARIAAAVARRSGLRGPQRGVRLVHGEADGLPGLVVDEYGECVVLQSTHAVVEAALDCIASALAEVTGCACVIARNDAAVRAREGLPREVRLLCGRRREEAVIREGALQYQVDPWGGHKTGFYLDQRPARSRVAELAQDRRVLDLFAYQGAFSLAALAGGARTALAVDQSAAALARARSDAERNGLAGLTTAEANAFDTLRELRGRKENFDLIVVDPPAFAKRRRERGGAERGYRDLNRQALRLLAPGGLLLTFSCSHHLSRADFEDVLRQAAGGLPWRAVLRERLAAGADHPVWLGHRESEYLKGCVVGRLD